jgi:transposase
MGNWRAYGQPNRESQLDNCKDWLQQQFQQHHGNAEVLRQELRQELERQKGIKVSQRTVERAVQPWRAELWAARLATVRYETRPGKQLQADFGELWVPIGGERVKVHLCVLTLDYFRRQVVRAYRNEQQANWLLALEEAFHHWGGIPEEVLPSSSDARAEAPESSLGMVRLVEVVLEPGS